MSESLKIFYLTPLKNPLASHMKLVIFSTIKISSLTKQTNERIKRKSSKCRSKLPR